MKDGPPSELHKPMRLGKRLFARPALLQYGIGILSFMLLGVSCYSIIIVATSTHANVSLQQISGKVIAKRAAAGTPTITDTSSPTVTTTPSPSPTTTPTNTPSPTPTNTPSPTVTNTPSPTSTSTGTPNPSPTTTPAATKQPSPKATVGQTTTPGPTPAGSATATAVITPGTGQNQTPGITPTPSNNQGPPADNGFPYMYIVVGLSGIAIVGFLFIPGWIFLRKPLLPMPAKKLPPSGAAPWKRTRTDDLQQQANMFSPPFTATGNSSFYAPTITPFSNMPRGNPGARNNQYIPQPGGFAAPGSFAPIPNAFNAMPTFPNASSVNQQPAPHANNPTPTNRPTSNSAPGIDPFAGISHSIDSSSPTIQKRLRRNSLRATGDQPVIGDQEMVGDFSADMAILSDPHLRAMIQQYSDKGRSTKLPPPKT